MTELVRSWPHHAPTADAPAPAIARDRVAASFGKAAAHYDVYAALQREVADTLLTLIPADFQPSAVLDLGCGTGYGTAKLQARFGASQLVALDLALPMLQVARERLLPGCAPVCADAAHLPFADDSFDLIYSSLTLQWCGDLAALFAEVKRVLVPGGRAIFSTFGPGSLKELRQAWSAADHYAHVNHFAVPEQLLEAARAQNLEAQLESRMQQRWYPDLRAVSRELKGIGAHNMNGQQLQGLTGRSAFARAEQAFASGQQQDKGVPVTYDIVYLQVSRPYE